MTQGDLWDEPVRVVDSKPVLMPVQQDFLERGRAAYASGAKRVVFQATCGAGKTVVAAEQTRRALAMGKTVLHVVHRRRLVTQMMGTLARFQISAGAIMEGHGRFHSPVQCASRDTLLAMLKGSGTLPRADLIVFDEAHVAADAVQQWYLKNCPDSYWTGYTATPVRPDGAALNPPYQKLVCMAPTSELMRLGRLCPVKVYDPKSSAAPRRRGDRTQPVGDPVAHWLKYANGLPTVVFAARVSDSREIVSKYLEKGVTAEHIDAFTEEDEREAVFERSRTGQTKVISNVGVMVEGVDLPWLVCCQILRGCNSLVLWIQGTGRVMRAFEGKANGIVLDHSGAVYEFGPPDSDFQWTLEDGAANEKANKVPKDSKPVSCPGCGFVFRAKPACPECGRPLPRKKQSSLPKDHGGDGVLTEFVEGQSQATRADAMLRAWTKALHIGRAKGWQMRQVAGMFTNEFKKAPWEAALNVPLPYGKQEWAMPVRDWMNLQRAES